MYDFNIIINSNITLFVRVLMINIIIITKININNILFEFSKI